MKKKMMAATMVNHGLPTTNQISICTSLNLAKEETQELILLAAKSHSDMQISPITSRCKSQIGFPSTHITESLVLQKVV